MKLYVFPGIIEDDILQAGSQQIPYMRTEWFSGIVKECETILLDLIGCSDGRVIFYTASGTGAMDAVVANYVTQKKKAFIIAGGSFGYRWRDLCEYYKCPYTLFEVPFAKDIDYVELEDALKGSEADVLLCQHHETSSGQLFDLERISGICRRHGVSPVADVISSFLADQLDMDGMGADICIASSQKGLNIPPGLSMVVLSEKISKERFGRNGYYFDFAENLKNLERGQTPYSPATTLFMQLHLRLQQIAAAGGAGGVIEKTRERARYFRELCAANGWEMPAQAPSDSITGFFVRRGGDILFRELLQKNIYIMPGGTKDYFRVSHTGLQSMDDLKELAEHILEIEKR